MTTGPVSGLFAAPSGAGAVRSKALRPTRAILMSLSASQPYEILTERVGDGNRTPIRERAGNRSLVLFDSGEEVTVQAGEEGIRFLLVSGKPIEEPVAWYGPIVMNTDAELEQALPRYATGRSSRNVTNDGTLRRSREDGRMQ
jgi:Pirin C-terminal cupin domain